MNKRAKDNSWKLFATHSTYLDDDADTVVTTTDIGRGYDEDALSLGSDERRSSHASQLQTMEEVERATREKLGGGGASAAKVRSEGQ